MEFVIAILAVTVTALIVMEPGSLVFALCVPMAIMALLSFDLFVCAMVFLLPWYPFIGWKLPVRDVFLLGRFVLLAGVWILQQKKGISLKNWLWEGWLKKGIVVFAAIAVISLLASDSRGTLGPYKAIAKLLSYAAVFFSIVGWAQTRERIATIIKVLLISTIGVALFGFYQAFDGSLTGLYFRLYPDMEEVFDVQGGWSGRITSFLFHYNSLAGYLNVVIPFALGVVVLRKDRWMRVLGFTCLSTATAALYLTSSRGGLIAYGAVALLSVWYLVPRRVTVAVILASVLVAVAIALPLTAKGEVQAERLQSVDDFTQQSRLALWGAAGIMFLEHPVLGAGFGTYRFTFHQHVPWIIDDLDSHNLYLQTLAETGVIGFSVFFIAMGAFFRTGARLIKSDDPLWRIVGIGVCGALAATMVHGLVDYIFIASPQFGNLFWLVLALATTAATLEGSQRKNAVVS